MFRAAAVLRAVVLVNAVGLNLFRHDNFVRPAAAVVVVLAMVVWTGVATWAYAAARRRTRTLLLLDLGLAVAAMLSSPILKGESFNATVPGYWVMGALMAWAVHWHVAGGLAAAAVLAATDLVSRDVFSQTNYGHVFLLLVGGPIVGYLAGSLQRMAAERDRAERAAAAAAERARLARAVHDGVLQVLALVQRRGSELGGEGARLAHLAGEQERSLRSLIRQQDVLTEHASAAPERDLTGALELLGTRHGLRVEVVTPGTPVLLPAVVVDGLVAAVSACLDNITAHVGLDARGWVLLEVLPEAVSISVRDEGPGIAPGRLEAAGTEGRLGVASSIRGRMAELGGSAHLDTGPHGTEWELRLPR